MEQQRRDEIQKRQQHQELNHISETINVTLL